MAVKYHFVHLSDWAKQNILGNGRDQESRTPAAKFLYEETLQQHQVQQLFEVLEDGVIKASTILFSMLKEWIQQKTRLYLSGSTAKNVLLCPLQWAKIQSINLYLYTDPSS